MLERFMPNKKLDAAKVANAANRFNTECDESSLIHLFHTVEPPRQELDLSPKGLQQFGGMMVNCLYEVDKSKSNARPSAKKSADTRAV